MTSSSSKVTVVLLLIFAAAIFRAAKFLQIDQKYILSSLFLISIATLILNDLLWKRRRLPPGPTPWLVAGNMPSFITSDNVDNLFIKWKRQFGSIFTVWIGPIPLVMVADLATIRKYFIQNADSFSNRWRNFVTDSIMEGSNGVVQIDGEKWREQRRFALHTLRDFGVGKPLMEQKIMLEVDALINFLGSKVSSDDGVNMCPPIAVCVGNIINNMLFGVRFAHGDAKMHKLHNLLDRQSRIVMKSIMGAYIAAPVLSKIPVVNSTWNELMTIKHELCQFLDEQIQDHHNRWNDQMIEEDVEDLTFAYMKESKKRILNNEQIGYFDDQQLQMLLLDLFFAGMETTVTTLKWAFLLIAKNPLVQKSVQDELDQLGVDRIELSHRPRLPYTQATINEIQRVANILPINLLRTVADDIEIDGFQFKKGDLIIPQISILMNDPEIFDDPHLFNPDRFLDQNRNLKRIDEFLPFSIGRRQCLGESLARAELFLIFANLLRSFNFHVSQQTSIDRLLGLTVSPPSYSCRVSKRCVDSNSNSI